MKNYSLAEAMKFFENTLNEVAPQNQITWKGKSEELKETSNEIYIIFCFSFDYCLFGYWLLLLIHLFILSLLF